MARVRIDSQRRLSREADRRTQGHLPQRPRRQPRQVRAAPGSSATASPTRPTKILTKNGRPDGIRDRLPGGGQDRHGDNYTDAWFVGFTLRLVATSVWVGHPEDPIRSVPAQRAAWWWCPSGRYMKKPRRWQLSAATSRPKVPFVAQPFFEVLAHGRQEQHPRREQRQLRLGMSSPAPAPRTRPARTAAARSTGPMRTRRRPGCRTPEHRAAARDEPCDGRPGRRHGRAGWAWLILLGTVPLEWPRRRRSSSRARSSVPLPNAMFRVKLDNDHVVRACRGQDAALPDQPPRRSRLGASCRLRPRSRAHRLPPSVGTNRRERAIAHRGLRGPFAPALAAHRALAGRRRGGRARAAVRGHLGRRDGRLGALPSSTSPATAANSAAYWRRRPRSPTSPRWAPRLAGEAYVAMGGSPDGLGQEAGAAWCARDGGAGRAHRDYHRRRRPRARAGADAGGDRHRLGGHGRAWSGATARGPAMPPSSPALGAAAAGLAALDGRAQGGDDLGARRPAPRAAPGRGARAGAAPSSAHAR